MVRFADFFFFTLFFLNSAIPVSQPPLPMPATLADFEKATGSGPGADRWRKALSLVAVVAMRPLKAVAEALFTAVTPTLGLRTDHVDPPTCRSCDPALWGKIKPEDIGQISKDAKEKLPQLKDAEKCAACVANVATLAGLHAKKSLPSHGVSGCDWANLGVETPWEVAKAFGSNLGAEGRADKKKADDFPVDFVYCALQYFLPIVEVLTDAQRDAFYQALIELGRCRNGYVMHAKGDDGAPAKIDDDATLDEVRIAVVRVLRVLKKLLDAWEDATGPHAGIVAQPALDAARAVIVEARDLVVAVMEGSPLSIGEAAVVTAIRNEIASVQADLAARAAESECRDGEILARVQSAWEALANEFCLLRGHVDEAAGRVIAEVAGSTERVLKGQDQLGTAFGNMRLEVAGKVDDLGGKVGDLGGKVDVSTNRILESGDLSTAVLREDLAGILDGIGSLDQSFKEISLEIRGCKPRAKHDIDSARATLIEPARFVTATRDFLSRAGQAEAKFAGRQWVAERVAKTEAPVVVIEGGMGVGKTTLASYLATPDTVDKFDAVAGYSFDGRNAATLSADAAVRTLVHQFASHDDEKVWRPYVEAAVFESGGRKGSDGPDTSLGRNGLTQEGDAMISGASGQPLTCGAAAAFSACIVEAARAVPGKRFLVVIDGLDEVGAESSEAPKENNVAQMLRHALLRDEPGRKPLPENLRVVLLSRRPTILDALKKPGPVARAEWIDLGARGHEPDAEHCRADVRTFLVDGHGVREDVAVAILARSGCHFQYASLIAVEARELQSADQVATKLPATLEARYAEILRSVAGSPEDKPIVQSILEVIVAASDVPKPLHRDECVGAVRLVRGITRILDAVPVRKVLDTLISSTLLEERGSGIQLLHASFREYLCAAGSEVSVDRRMGHRALAGFALLAAESAAMVQDESSDESSDESETVSGEGIQAWTRVVEWVIAFDGSGTRGTSTVGHLKAFECGGRTCEATPAAVAVHLDRALRPGAGIVKKESFPTSILARLLSLSGADIEGSLAVLAWHGDLRLVKRYVVAAKIVGGALTPDIAERALAMAVGHIDVLYFLLNLDDWGDEYPSALGLGQALFMASLYGHVDTTQALLDAGADHKAADSLGRTPLIVASANGHLDVVKALLDAGADCTAVHKDGVTPLHVASHQGHRDVVKALLNFGADATAANKDGWTPLHVASLNGHLDVVKTLIDAGADAIAMDKDGWTPLHGAAQNGHLDVVKALVDAGADASAMNKDGVTPLHLASEDGHLDVVKALVDAGADASAVNKDGVTPLHVASEDGHLDVVKALVDAGADASAVNKYGVTPLHTASPNGHLDVVRALLKAGADARVASETRWTPLHSASRNGHLDVVRALLVAGADATAVNTDSWTPLYVASQDGHLDVVKVLLVAGADATAVNKDEWTPLHVASLNGHLDVVKALLVAGADATAVNKDGLTPLHLASQNGHLDVVRALLEAGADATAANNDGWTPLHTVSHQGHLDVVKALVDAGADASAVNKDGAAPLHVASKDGHLDVVKALLGAGADTDAADKDGWTPLHLASQNGQLAVVTALLDAGAGATAVNKDGLTPLHTASHQGHLDVVKALLVAGADATAVINAGLTPLHFASGSGHLDVVKALLVAGANAMAASETGLTPLHVASLNGHLDVVKALLDAGADTDAADKDGWTPLRPASENGHLVVVKALLDAGADAMAASETGWTPLRSASGNGHLAVVRALLDAGADATAASETGWTPLHAASQNGHLDVVKALLDAGADATAVNKDGLTPLHTASHQGHLDLVTALINAEADATAVNKVGWTPLHVASGNGQLAVVRALLVAGADTDAADNDGRTPLHAASRNGHLDVVRALLVAGASSWHPFGNHDNFVAALLAAGAKPTPRPPAP
jgi:ankyrin repeat protein